MEAPLNEYLSTPVVALAIGFDASQLEAVTGLRFRDDFSDPWRIKGARFLVDTKHLGSPMNKGVDVVVGNAQYLKNTVVLHCASANEVLPRHRVSAEWIFCSPRIGSLVTGFADDMLILHNSQDCRYTFIDATDGPEETTREPSADETSSISAESVAASH